MVALGTNFNAQSVAPYEAAGAIWEGRVPVTINKTEILPTAANDGQSFLALHVTALDAPYKGQNNVLRLNLYNKSAQAVDIAQRQLSSICHVTGKMQVTDADQLLNVPFISIWQKGSRNITDQATGSTRSIETCECREWQFIDGRSIKEAMAGQAASNPYTPGQSGGPQAAGFNAPQPQPQAQAQPQPQPQPQAGFQPPPPSGGPQPGLQQATGQGAGFAPPGAFAPPAAQGQGGVQQQQQPVSGFGTAASPSSGFAAPAAGPQAGAGPWGAQGGQAQGGFGPR